MKETKTILAKDDMHTLHSHTIIAEDESDVAEALKIVNMPADFDGDIFRIGLSLKLDLQKNGWPRWNTIVDFTSKENWSEVVAIGNTYPIIPVGYKRSNARYFIEKFVQPLSDDYFMWRIAYEIDRLLAQIEPQRKLLMTFELGRLCERWEARKAFQRNFSIGKKTQRERREGGRQNVHPDRMKILAAMKPRIDAGYSIRQAADATFHVDHLGTSGIANREIWKREKAAMKKRG